MTHLLKQKYVPHILVLTLILLVTAVTISAASGTSTPNITSNSPATDSITDSSNVTISFTVADPDLISTGNYYIKLNGTTISSKFEYRGHLETDSCGSQYWVIDGYDQATITGSAANLRDGPHTIQVQATDRLGNPVTKTWTFNVASKPVISDMTTTNVTPSI